MVLQGHVKGILGLDFSSNGYTVATGSEDNSIRIWDIRQARCSYTIPAHTNLVSQVRFWRAGDGFEGGSMCGEGWRFDGGGDANGIGKGKGKERENGGSHGMNEADDMDEDDYEKDMVLDWEDDGDASSSLRKQLLSGGHLVSSSFDGTCKIFTEGDWKPIKSLTGLEGKVMGCDVSPGKFVCFFACRLPLNCNFCVVIFTV
jgi:U4/U6 small nuclear ribonucleoprotein PRP4